MQIQKINQKNPIKNFPLEIWSYCLLYLPIPHIFRLQQINHEYNCYLKQNVLWNTIINNYFQFKKLSSKMSEYRKAQVITDIIQYMCPICRQPIITNCIILLSNCCLPCSKLYHVSNRKLYPMYHQKCLQPYYQNNLIPITNISYYQCPLCDDVSSSVFSSCLV